MKSSYEIVGARETKTARACSLVQKPSFFSYWFHNVFFHQSLIVVIGLLNSFRDGNDLKLRQLDNISDAVLLVCRCTWAKRPSQPGDRIPFIIHFINSRFCSIYGLLLCCDCFFGKIGIHPNVVFPHLIRFRGSVVMKNNETCNALKCLKPSVLIEWIN